MSCCLSLLIVSMDATIVNVAVPAIRSDLGATTSQLQWVIDIYTLALASLLMLSGAAGDRSAVAGCSRSGSPSSRPGRCCAVWHRTSTSDRRAVHPGDRRLDAQSRCAVDHLAGVHRSRRPGAALGFWGAVVGISMALGPIVGGLLIEVVGWRAVFWINLPICAAAIILTAIFVPESKSATMRNIDPIGQGLAVIFLFGIVYTLIEGPVLGWTNPRTVTVFVIALLAFVAFLRYEARRNDPFVDLHFFRSIPFASATLTAISALAAWGAFLFIMALYLQDERGYSALHTGLIYLPVAIGALVFSPLSGRLVGRFGSRPSLLAAGVLITAASVMLTLLTATTPVWALLIIFAVFGIGFSMVNAPITNAAVSGMPLDRAGAASAVTSTSRQIGVSIGVALCGSVAGSALSATGTDFATAARPLWFVCVGLGVTIFVLGILSTSPRAIRSAERLAPLIEGPPPQEVRVRVA